MIEVNNLTKTFEITKKAPGLKDSLKSLFNREAHKKNALDEVSKKEERQVLQRKLLQEIFQLLHA